MYASTISFIFSQTNYDNYNSNEKGNNIPTANAIITFCMGYKEKLK